MRIANLGSILDDINSISLELLSLSIQMDLNVEYLVFCLCHDFEKSHSLRNRLDLFFAEGI
jgi:hypothetical protein